VIAAQRRLDRLKPARLSCVLPRQVQGARAGVEVAVPVAVAAVHPVGAGGAVLRTADRVGLGRKQGVDEGLQQLTQQIGLAWASCSSSSRAGSILDVTVIVVSFFESVVRDHSK
jgi:hypothetical protein